MQSHIRRVHACLTVTCHLHFWQNDRDLFTCYCGNTGVERIPNAAQPQRPAESCTVTLTLACGVNARYIISTKGTTLYHASYQHDKHGHCVAVHVLENVSEVFQPLHVYHVKLDQIPRSRPAE